ncbi:MAG: lamin tail domain-containing protein [Chitinophagaceae bacterium]
MKGNFTRLKFLLLTFALSFGLTTQAQFGRLIINEYMPWPGLNCGSQSEFIELMNMGPGPVNIGCYILTDGHYSITIPPGTIIEPGGFYILAGQTFLPAPCANWKKDVTADLNWNTCNCMNKPITDPEGLMTDGGFSTESMVLMTDAGVVVDALGRGIPPPAETITTAEMNGCAPFTFNLDEMNISYEPIIPSTGRGNSIARVNNGDCEWHKETHQNAGENNSLLDPNNSKYPFRVAMFITEDLNCTSGNARFLVTSEPIEEYFPLNYIMGRDLDGDGVYTFADAYWTGQDATAPDLIFENLPFGVYKIVIGPVMGCGYRTYDFIVGPCATMNFKLQSFEIEKEDGLGLFAEILNTSEVNRIMLEGSRNGADFYAISEIPFNKAQGIQGVKHNFENEGYTYFRIVITDDRQKSFYSPVRTIRVSTKSGIQVAGNPVKTEIKLITNFTKSENLNVKVVNSTGQMITEKGFNVNSGSSNIYIPAQNLTPGMYYVRVDRANGIHETLRILKE